MKRLAAMAWGLALLAAPVLGDEGDDLLAKGEAVYKQFCSHCHGIGMVNPGTGSFDLRKFPVDEKDRFVQSVTKGRGDMPAWGDILFPEELESVWVYVATRGGKAPLPDKAASAPAAAPELVADGALTVCLARNGGALSGKRADGGSGLDYRVSEEVARRMGLTLAVTWFESEQEEETDPVREAYAMLALRLCDLVPAHALVESALGPPHSATAAPPRWEDMPASWGHRHVELAPVAATLPYMRAEMGVVLGPGAEGREISGLDDLTGLRVAIQQGTLSGALARAQAPPAMRKAMITFPPGPKFLWVMETGAFDAALVDVAAFDFHLRQNPLSKLRLSAWRHPLGFNIGAAALAANAGLIAGADAAIAAMLADGAVAALAAAEHVSYAAPRKPWVHPRLTRQDLLATR